MKNVNKLKPVLKKSTAILLAVLFLSGLFPALDAPLFTGALAAANPSWIPGPNEAYITGTTQTDIANNFKTALADSTVTTIYLGADVNLRQWGLTGTDNPNTSTSNNAYTNNSTYLMNIAARNVTINGTDPKTGNRHTYTDRRTNDNGSIPLVLSNTTAMTFTFKDIDIYGYNYYGLFYGNSSVKYNLVFDGVYGVMTQFVCLGSAVVTVRDSIMKVRDTGLRSGEEFFECGSMRIEGNSVFDHQSTGNHTFFTLNDGTNRSLTVADSANVTLIERGYNAYGIIYPSDNKLIINDNAKMTSILAEPEGATADNKASEPAGSFTGYTTGLNQDSTVVKAAQSYFTFSGASGHASVMIGAGAELNIFHPYNTTNGYDILRTTTSAGITVNEGGILNVYSMANNSRVLNTSNLTLNNPRMVALYTASSNNYLFNGTTPLKASKLKSIRYYSTAGDSYTFDVNALAGSGYDSTNKVYLLPGDSATMAERFTYYSTFSGKNQNVNTNRTSPTTWFYQFTNSFDVTSSNINGTGTVSNSTYIGSSGTSGVQTSITSANLNANAMRVVVIDGDYSRKPTIVQAEAGQTYIRGTGVPGARVNLYDSSGTLLKSLQVDVDGEWRVDGLIPLVAKTVYFATQQANILGNFSSPSTQVTMTVNAKMFRLNATNNTAKTNMTGYINAGFNNVGKASGYKIERLEVIIFNDPDTVLPAESAFESTYKGINSNDADSASNDTGTAYKVMGTAIPASAGVDDYMSVGRLIQYNCRVWARATITANGKTDTYFDSVGWRNIFTPYTVWLRAIIKGSSPIDRLFDYETVNATSPATQYGLPYQGDGKTIYANPAYSFDSVKLTAASTNLAHKDDLVGHWIATVGGTTSGTPYDLYLNRTLGTPAELCDDGDPSKYTLNYEHKPGTWWENAPVEFVYADKSPATVKSKSTDKISIPRKIGNDGNPIANMSANNNDAAGSSTRVSFRMLGGRYTPPSDTGNSPIGWYVATAAKPVTSGDYNSLSDFNSDAFNPIFQTASDTLYIVYAANMFQIVEEYYSATWDNNNKTYTSLAKIDTDKIQYHDYDTTAPYDKIQELPKTINGYLPIGWDINGSAGLSAAEKIYHFDFADMYTNYVSYNLSSPPSPVANQYDIFPKFDKTVAKLEPASGGGTVTIRFFYTLDTKHNGIPNDEEKAVTVRWRGYTVDGASWAIQPFNTIYGRGGYPITIPNTYTDPAYPLQNAIGQNGISAHKIKNTVIPQQPETASWLFDKSGAALPPDLNPPQQTATLGTTTDVFFNYDFSTDGENADKEQYVDEEYCIADTDAKINTTAYPDTRTYVLKGGSYYKLPPEISGYVYVGYKWDGTNGDFVYHNGSSPLPVTKLTTALKHKVTFLYRPAAGGSVTVQWIGKTYAGADMTFATMTKTGYNGENVTIEASEAAVSSGWKFVSMSSATGIQGTDPNKLTFTLGSSAQTGTFMYGEIYDEVTITAKYQSDDGSLNFTQTFPPSLASNTAEPVAVTPFTLNGYELTGWVIYDNYGTELRNSGSPSVTPSDPVSILPAGGSQTIVFSYKSTLTTLYIRCLDETGKELPGTAQKISNVSIGEVYYANAPYSPFSQGYALKTDEPLIKSITISGGTNTVYFNYEKITGNAYIILNEKHSENTADDTIIGYQVIPTAVNGMPVTVPDLSSAYYTPVTEDEQQTYNGAPLTFRYTKNTVDVVIQPIDQKTKANIGTAKTLTGAARVGEMYAATCDISVQGYTLAESISKNAFADPGLYNETTPLPVKFAYKQDQHGDVTVISYYGGNKDDLDYRLGEYKVTAVVGSKLTVDAESFAGFTVIQPNKVDITVADTNPAIYFQYTDDRKLVTVKHYNRDSGTWAPFAASIVDKTIRVVSADYTAVQYIVDAANIPGYVLTGYTKGTDPTAGGITAVPLGTSQVPAGNVQSDTTVYLCYEKTEEAINEQLIPITVKGMNGSGTLYEYTLNRVKNSGSFTVYAQNMPGYTLTSVEPFKTITVGTASVSPIVFNYDSLAMNVTIKAVQSGGGAVPGFADIVVPAVSGQPFSYNAPYIPGWDLSGSITQTINSVSDSDKTLTFTYTQASGNVTIVLKEDSSAGRIIKTQSQTIPSGISTIIPVPVLSGEYYTSISLQKSVTYTSSPLTVEYYYTKQIRNVNVDRYDTTTGNTKIDTASTASCRIGEVSIFDAPVPPAPVPPATASYKLAGDIQKLVLIKSIAADAAQTVIFNYTSILPSELAVNAVAESTGTLLYTYALTGITGQNVTVLSQAVSGYLLKPGESASKTGTFGGQAVTFTYAKNVSQVTVKLIRQGGGGGDITYLASGYPTLFEVEKGKSCTVIAPNLTGYVLIDGQASQVTLSSSDTQTNQEVTFTYRAINDMYVTHTIIGHDDTTNTGLYTYSFSVLKDSGDTVYTPATIPGYHCRDAEKMLSNGSDISYTFKYTAVTGVVTVKAVEKDDTSNILATYAYNGYDGEDYYVRAPYVEKGGTVYALDSNEPLYKSVEVNAGDNTITFKYVPVQVGDVVLALKETNGNIIRLIQVTSTDINIYDSTTIPGLLSGDYYTYDGTNPLNAAVTNPITSTSPAGMYTFYYTKNTRNVVVSALSGGTEIGRSPNYMGRIGEMLGVTAFPVTGYSLIGQPNKSVYVDPAITDDPQVVKFNYSKDQPQAVTVTAFYTDGTNNKHTLFSYSVSGVAGSKILIDVPGSIDGWTLKSGYNLPKEHTITGPPATDSYEFEYVKKTVDVTVLLKDMSGADITPPSGYSLTQTVQADLPVTISPPPINGYVFVSSTPTAYVNCVYNTAATLTFTYKKVTDQATIMFVLKDTEDRQLDVIYKSGTIGTPVYVVSTVKTSISSFDDSKLTQIEVSGVAPYTTNFNTVQAIYGTHTMVTLTCAYQGVFTPPATGEKKVPESPAVYPKNPRPGDKVTVVITPEDGYELADLSITDADGNTVVYEPTPPTLGPDGTYTVTYTQPDSAVTIKRSFRAKGTGGNSVVIPPTENGSVTVNPKDPSPGDTVTVLITPNDGYDLDTLTITSNADGSPITYSPNTPVPNPDGTYTVTYTQPAGGATVDPTFKKKSPYSSSVDIEDTENGSVNVNPKNPAGGVNVTVTITPNTGYDLASLSILNDSGNSVAIVSPLAYQNNGTYKITYTQPLTGKAKVKTGFVPSVVIKDTAYGTVTVSSFNSWPTEQAKVTITPIAGYVPSSVKITGVNTTTLTPALTVSKTTKANTPVFSGEPTGAYTADYTQPFYGAVVEVEFTKTGGASVEIPPPTNGKATVSPSKPKPGDKVTITVTPDNGFTVGDLTITDSNGQPIPYIDNGDGTYTYIQPDDKVTVNVTFIPSVIVGRTKHGTITVNPTYPDVGETVTITATPENGYDIGTVTVKDSNGNPVTLTDNGNGTYTYEQPSGGVKIDATFDKQISITIVATNGSVRVRPVSPNPGDTVDVVTIPNNKYVLTSLSIKGAKSGLIAYEGADGLFTYKQPDEDVTITAVFEMSYIIIETTNGSLMMSPANPKPGAEVTLTAVPSHGYVYDASKLVFKNGAGKIITDTIEFIPPTPQSSLQRSAPVEIVIKMPDVSIFEIDLDFVFDPSYSTNTVKGNIKNGRLSVSPPNPSTDDPVTLTLTSNPGYVLDSLDIIANTGGSSVPYTIESTVENSDGTYTYTVKYRQPDGGVTVNAEFKSSNITISPTQHGGVRLYPEGSPYYAKTGIPVKIIIRPDNGYTLDTLKLNGQDAVLTDISFIDEPAKNDYYYIYTYTQPAVGSVVTAAFKPSVTINVTGRGVVKLDDVYPKPGETVNITAAAAHEYELTSLTYTKGTLSFSGTGGLYSSSYVQPTMGGSAINAVFSSDVPANQAYKDTAKQDIEAHYQELLEENGKSYNSSQKAALKRARDDALKAIDNAVTKSDIDNAWDRGIDKMDAVPVGGGGGGNGVNGGSGTFSTGVGINITPPDHGSATADKNNPTPGETVTVTIKPDDGYVLDTLAIKDASGNAIPYERNSDGTYTFIQPLGQVTVTAAFKPEGSSDVSSLLNTDDHMIYVSGRGNNTFEPSANMTRAEVAQLFYNLLRNKNVAVTKSFPDVPDGKWYTTAVNMLASMGIITGMPDGNFYPNKPITRAEFSALVVRFAGISPGSVRFNDVPVSHWAYDYINTAANFGWVTGVGNGNFMPDRNITRAEAVTLMNRVLGRYPDKAMIDSLADLIRFSDVDTDHWAYYQIVEAANAHDYDKDGTVETWK